jgi:hypothetical protein
MRNNYDNHDLRINGNCRRRQNKKAITRNITSVLCKKGLHQTSSVLTSSSSMCTFCLSNGINDLGLFLIQWKLQAQYLGLKSEIMISSRYKALLVNLYGINDVFNNDSVSLAHIHIHIILTYYLHLSFTLLSKHFRFYIVYMETFFMLFSFLYLFIGYLKTLFVSRL